MRVVVRRQSPQCFLLAKGLEPYAHEVEVEQMLPRYSSEPEEEYKDVDCSINAYPPIGKGGDVFASLYFVKGRLLDGDIVVKHARAGDVRDALDRAPSCTLTETHFHGSEETPELHFHLAGCNLRDVGTVLEAGGYKS